MTLSLFVLDKQAEVRYSEVEGDRSGLGTTFAISSEASIGPD